MIIFPAIDIKGGKCVRLLKGSFDDITKYNKSPLDQAKEFSNLGLIKEIIIDPNRIWYDTCVNNHYHFYNSATNQLIDIPEAQIKVSKLPSIPKGHKIDQMNVVIHLQRKD